MISMLGSITTNVCYPLERQVELLEMARGLLLPKKRIASKFLYDSVGSELFNRISKQPEYYVTRTERRILEDQADKIAATIQGGAINLVELGPGCDEKTLLLIDAFRSVSSELTYSPIDISSQMLNSITDAVKSRFPGLPCLPIEADFQSSSSVFTRLPDSTTVVTFLGSSIGNMTARESTGFIRSIGERLDPHDFFLIGFDLWKSQKVLLQAYDDSAGVTREFNLNLLDRMNRELGGSFSRTLFKHVPVCNSESHCMESYLESLCAQRIWIDALGQFIEFQEGERIHVEYSFKYTRLQIHQLASTCGFRVAADFTDEQKLFVDSLWQKI